MTVYILALIENNYESTERSTIVGVYSSAPKVHKRMVREANRLAKEVYNYSVNSVKINETDARIIDGVGDEEWRLTIFKRNIID